MCSVARRSRWPTTASAPLVMLMPSSSLMASSWPKQTLLRWSWAFPSGGSTSKQVRMWRPEAIPRLEECFEHPGLRVSASSPERLLAMKILASRARDCPPTSSFSIQHLDVASAGQALALAREIFPEEQVPDRARFAP